MFNSSAFFPVVRRSLAAACVVGTGLAVAGAQTSAPQNTPATDTSAQPIHFQSAAVPSFSSSFQHFSSSASNAGSYDPAQAANTQLASVENSFKMPGANAMQYGQRRRYGAPRYRGGNNNADGSEKYTVYAGAGFAVPGNDNFNYASTGWGFQVGGGRNFNRHFGTMLEFDYDHFGMTDTTLNNQQSLYNYIIDYYGGAGNEISGLGGNNHIWSFTLDPTYTFHQGEGLGGYIIGGVGFYHKVANFTVPTEGEYCDYYGFCYDVVANQNVDHYTSNAFGLNAGIGFTYKFSRFANERLYGEVRYVYTLNSARDGVTLDTVTAGNNVAFPNDFPQNSARTAYLPVKFGIRF